MNFEYRKLRRFFIALFLIYIVIQSIYLFISINKTDERINHIVSFNSVIVSKLSDINRDFIKANNILYDFEADRGGSLLDVVSLMEATIKKCKFVQESILIEAGHVELNDINKLILNAKLIRMTANNYHESLSRTKTGSSKMEIDVALHDIMKEPILTSFETIEKIRKNLNVYMGDILSYLRKQRTVMLFLILLQIVAFLLVAILLAKVLNWNIYRLLSMTDAIAKGDFSKRLDIIGDDSLAHLCSSLNDTAKQLDIVHKDLEEKKRCAEVANEAKSRFLSNVSHEIRTPLNCISGFSELISYSDNLSDIKQKANVVLAESRHLLGLINTILDHAKIESGKLQLEKDVFDLPEEIKRHENMMKSMINAKKVRFILNLDDSIPQYVHSDLLRFSQIIRNLLSNAAKFTEKGHIMLKALLLQSSETTCTVKFVISDTGIGIPEDKLDVIFDSFTQVDDSITRKYGGTGLGTTITKELVALFGSQLKVNSIPDKGSTFEFDIEFELSDKDSVDAYLKNKTQHRQNFEVVDNDDVKVLIVDDYKPNQMLFQLYLNSLSLRCHLAINGHEAVELCKSNSYSLIYIDVQMPVMNGFDAVKLIRKDSLARNAYIVGISADASTDIHQKCINAGMDTVLCKPISQNDFLKVISNLSNKL